MRVKRSEALRTRMETRRQRTLLATAFSNVLKDADDAHLSDQNTVADAHYEVKKKRNVDALVSEHEDTRGTPGYDAISLNPASNAITYRMEDPSFGVAAMSPNSFVQHPPMTPDVAARIANLEIKVQQVQNELSVERNFRMYLQTEVQALTSRITTLEVRP